MDGNADLVARALGAISLLISAVALWLNWQKNERDLASLSPQIAVKINQLYIRRWRVEMVVYNPLQVPMTWTTVKVTSPEGMWLANGPRGERGLHPPFQTPEPIFGDVLPMPDGPITIAPGTREAWSGLIALKDEFPAKSVTQIVIDPWIEGFEPRQSLRRRIQRWIWPRAIRM